VKEIEMHTIAVRCTAATLFGLVVLALLVANGCGQRVASTEGKPYCGDKTVKADAGKGADPEAVYVCEGDTVTWDPNGTTFIVEFKKDSPFGDDGKKFDNGNRKSKKTKKHNALKVYEYKIIVNNQTFDPQVVGGGNP
jgi:plastocyanin